MADGGTHSGRQLYQAEMELSLPGKLHISSNFMLHFSAQDQAIRDRLVVIRYNRRFVPNPTMENESPSNSHTVARMLEDTDAIGTWMAIGAQKAIQDLERDGKISIPSQIKAETNAEIDKLDVLHAFITHQTELHNRVKSAKGHQLFTMYFRPDMDLREKLFL